MTSRDFESWMWVDAVRMLERADRLQREFFRPHSPRPAQWQPPVDVFESDDATRYGSLSPCPVSPRTTSSSKSPATS